MKRLTLRAAFVFCGGCASAVRGVRGICGHGKPVVSAGKNKGRAPSFPLGVMGGSWGWREAMNVFFGQAC